MNEDERIKLEADVEKTKNKILSLRNSIEKLPNNKGSKIGKDFESGINSLKKFGLSLFSIGTIYSAVSKASSAYLSQDTEMAKRLQNLWVGLGSFLAPAIDYISNSLLKGLGYLNEFVKALTGIDFIARANAKALEKQASAQKQLNNQTFDFDEIRKIEDNSSSASNISTGSGLIEIPELDENIIKKLQDLAFWLKENWNWISKVGIALGVAFGAVKIAGLMKNIKSLVGAGGLGGLSTALMAVATVWLVTLAIEGVQEVIQSVKELNDSMDKLTKNERGVTNQNEKLSNAFWELQSQGKATAEQQKVLETRLKETTDRVVQQYNELEESKNWWGQITGANQKATEQQMALYESLLWSTTQYKKLYDQGLLNEQSAKDYYDTLGKQIKIMDELGIESKSLKSEYERLAKQYNIQVVTTFDAKETDQYKKTIADVKSISGAGSIAITASQALHNTSSRGFALGDIVTQPTRAIIGEAGYPEAVVPMTPNYLSTLAEQIAQFGGGSSGNGNVNYIYLDGRLIERQMNNTKKYKDFATNK